MASRRFSPESSSMTNERNNLLYIGLNRRVAALEEETGRIVWEWKASKGYGFVSLLLLDKQKLIASVQGYTYCLDAITGEQLWYNELEGFGVGVAAIASPNATSSVQTLLAAAAQAQAASAGAASGATVSSSS